MSWKDKIKMLVGLIILPFILLYVNVKVSLEMEEWLRERERAEQIARWLGGSTCIEHSKAGWRVSRNCGTVNPVAKSEGDEK